MKENQPLSPCPFCGDTEIATTWLRATDDCQWFGVCCEGCKAEIERASAFAATEAWNRRASPDSTNAA